MLQALILSERLQAVGVAFDRCRALRYQQLLQAHERLRQRQPLAADPTVEGYGRSLEPNGASTPAWEVQAGFGSQELLLVR